MARAVELLGARCMLTGVRASIAHTLVSMGADLGTIRTFRTLKDALHECVRVRQQER